MKHETIITEDVEKLHQILLDRKIELLRQLSRVNEVLEDFEIFINADKSLENSINNYNKEYNTI